MDLLRKRWPRLVIVAAIAGFLVWLCAGCDDPATAEPSGVEQVDDREIDIDIHVPPPVVVPTGAKPAPRVNPPAQPVRPAAPKPAAPPPPRKLADAGPVVAPTSAPPSCCWVPSPRPTVRPAS